jgi:hypothetical protein
LKAPSDWARTKGERIRRPERVGHRRQPDGKGNLAVEWAAMNLDRLVAVESLIHHYRVVTSFGNSRASEYARHPRNGMSTGIKRVAIIAK